jgi:hypothetical protein
MRGVERYSADLILVEKSVNSIAPKIARQDLPDSYETPSPLNPVLYLAL